MLYTLVYIQTVIFLISLSKQNSVWCVYKSSLCTLYYFEYMFSFHNKTNVGLTLIPFVQTNFSLEIKF